MHNGAAIEQDKLSRVVRWSAESGHSTEDDLLAIEEPLEIRLKGKAVCVTMRTPGDDAALAAGFLLSEGVIRSAEDINQIAPCLRAIDGNVINVFTSAEVAIDFAKLTRHVFASSSCGVCGAASLEAIQHCYPPIRSSLEIGTSVLQAMPDQLRRAQPVFARTGGLHAAGLFGVDGALHGSQEDVGRHNAVDKVIGRAMLEGRLPLDNAVLAVSGRVSFEVVQKALSAGIPMITAVSAPTSLAVELAQDAGLTLVGFVRPGRMNVYSHAHRVKT